MVGIELQVWNQKDGTKNPHKALFLWKQLDSSPGLKAARIACNAIQEKINFNIISMPIYVHIKCVSFYIFHLRSFFPVFSGQVLQGVALLYRQEE